MNDALEKLEAELSKNQKILADLTQQSENIQKNNEHLMYTIELLKKSGTSRVRLIMPAKQQVTDDSEGEEKITLRAAILNSIKKGEEVTVSDMFDRVMEQDFDTTKATINTNLANFVNKGILVRTEPGVYKKV